MSEMVERLARVMCVADGEDPDLLVAVGPVPRTVKFGYAAPLSAEPNWTFRVGYVRTLLWAMREPTEIMLATGCHAQNDTMDASWRAMIDEALK